MRQLLIGGYRRHIGDWFVFDRRLIAERLQGIIKRKPIVRLRFSVPISMKADLIADRAVAYRRLLGDHIRRRKVVTMVGGGRQSVVNESDARRLHRSRELCWAGA